MELKPGSRWKSAVCDTEVVVVRPPMVRVPAPVLVHSTSMPVSSSA